MSNARHIVHLAKYYPPTPGGIETAVQTLARAQVRCGLSVTVICLTDPDEPRAGGLIEETDAGVRILRVRPGLNVYKLALSMQVVRLIQTLSCQPGTVLHLHTPNPTMILALATAGISAPLVIMHHSDIIRQRVLRLGTAPLDRYVYGRAAQVQATNPRYVEGSRTLQRCGGRLRVLPLGLDLSRLVDPSAEARAARDRWRSTLGEPLWLCVGRLVYYKGLSTAIAALPRMPGRLLIVGSGPLRGELERQVSGLGLSDRVVFAGQAGDDDLVGAYHAATALLLPSNARSEAFGLVQVEAMACGCPVVNTDIAGSGVPWVSVHEQTGLTVAVGDAGALAAAAGRLVTEAGLRERLSAAAVRRAREEFSDWVMAQRSVALYEQVLASPKERR